MMSKKSNTRRRIRTSPDDRIFYAVINIVLTLIFLSVLYPIIYIVSSSFSSGAAVASGKVTLFPVDFSLEGYKVVFQYRSLLTSYRNTIVYTTLGTLINISVTMMAAYPLSRDSLPFRKFFSFLFVFTMLFNGGLVPSYILVRDLKLMNTMWALLLPIAMSVYNMIIARTFIQNTIPKEMLEASQIDGCNDTQFFFRMILPLSGSLLAVLSLMYAVGHWNSYFSAMIYISNRNLLPLQMILREVLVMSQIDPALINDPELMAARMGLADLLKYSLIVISTVPILLVYPFVQKYFVKGVMIGSLKG